MILLLPLLRFAIRSWRRRRAGLDAATVPAAR